LTAARPLANGAGKGRWQLLLPPARPAISFRTVPRRLLHSNYFFAKLLIFAPRWRKIGIAFLR